MRILEGDIKSITTYDYDKYLGFDTWVKSVGSFDAKWKENTGKQERDDMLNCKF